MFNYIISSYVINIVYNWGIDEYQNRKEYYYKNYQLRYSSGRGASE